MLRLPPQATLAIQQYRKRWLRAGHESLRVALAVRRCLKPLLLAYHAGRGIECTVDELLADGPFELTNFVRHGLEREEILLRAQRGTARDRAERRYGGPAGLHSSAEAARLTRREVGERIEQLRRLINYLDFVEKNHR
jgi:hypothetical protein